jgi:hypothetical protein
MGRYNSFVHQVACPDGHTTEVELQAYVGWPDWSVYRVGDSLQNLAPPRGVRFLPPEARGASRFWVYGLGTCAACGAEIHVQLRFRDLVFVDAHPVEPPASYAESLGWGTWAEESR